MQFYVPKVKEISLFKEIVKNIVNPLEIVREAISNSVDAEAKNIIIELYRNEKGLFCINFIDDGNGMDKRELESFFNLGDSEKNRDNIGEKGLGSKIFFKSINIIVKSQKNNNQRIIAKMNNPWKCLCNNKIPKYSVDEEEIILGKNGTEITIEGYLVNNPEKYYNLETLKDYLLWFTAAGSFKNIFSTFSELNSYVKNMQISPRIYIRDKIANEFEEISGGHRFSLPEENPKEDDNEKIYRRSVNYCRHYGPYNRSTNINGEYVSFQMYGTVSGLNCRKEICKLKTGETFKGRFGIYIAKDFIPFVKKPILITDSNYHHFHILVNSQNFELTADRNNVSNEDDLKIKWIYNTVKKIINNDILPITNNTYFKIRKQEEINYLIDQKRINLEERINNLDKIELLNIESLSIKSIPDNEAQVVLLLSSILSNNKFKKYISSIESIIHYSSTSTTDLICLDNNGKVVLSEVEYNLSNLFKHDHPYKTFDYIICWKVDMEINDRKNLIDGTQLKLCLENDKWILKYGAEKIIPVIELSNIINLILDNKNKEANIVSN